MIINLKHLHNWQIAITAALLLVSLAPSSGAAAPASGRLRVVVRTVLGRGVQGLVVHINLEAIDESIARADFATGSTDQRGVVDFNTQSPHPWPIGGYQIRIASGTSKLPVMSQPAQDLTVPPMGIEIRGSADSWAMYALDYQGNLLPDYSLSLLAPPQLHAPSFPTPAPISISQALAERGLPTSGPQISQPTPGGPVAIAALLPPNAPPPSPSGSGGENTKLLWLIALAIIGGALLLRGTLAKALRAWLTSIPRHERKSR